MDRYGGTDQVGNVHQFIGSTFLNVTIQRKLLYSTTGTGTRFNKHIILLNKPTFITML